MTNKLMSLDLPRRQITRTRTWTGEIEWYTPPDILKSAYEVMGGIDLDPASSDAQQAQALVKAKQYFTIANNGLERPWHGRVWLNPPYARGWIDLFVEKMVTSYRSGEMSAGIMLTNSATETRWWQMAAGACDALCFRRGRVRFLKSREGCSHDRKFCTITPAHFILFWTRHIAFFARLRMFRSGDPRTVKPPCWRSKSGQCALPMMVALGSSSRSNFLAVENSTCG